MFVDITKDDGVLKFSSKDNRDISLSVYKKDSKDGQYYTQNEGISFSDTYTYNLQANSLYKFIFKYRGDSEIITTPTNSLTAIPEMPEMPNITIPTAPVIQADTVPPIPAVDPTGADQVQYIAAITQILNSISAKQAQIDRFSKEVETYNTERGNYNNKANEYNTEVEKFNTELDKYKNVGTHKQVIQKEFIDEYTVGYYPKLLDNIIRGCIYILNATEDIATLYNNKDRGANSLILRILYYNSLCLNHCNQNIIYTINALYYKLLHFNNMFEESQIHRGLDNTFIQEKIIIASYYIAYLVDALKVTTNKTSVLNKFRFNDIQEALKLININLADIYKYAGLSVTKDTSGKTIVRDMNINLSNREVYNFTGTEFNIEGGYPTHITFVSVPIEGVLYFDNEKVSLGQRIPFADISRVRYVSKDMDNEYSTIFKFILE